MHSEEDVIRTIRDYVEIGMEDEEEIADIVGRDMYGGELDDDWLRAEIASAVAARREEAKDWPAVTDCDRIAQAFESLREQHIVALQNTGQTDDHGIEDISQVWHEEGGESSPIIGYCFFHEQNIARVLGGGPLSMCYGDIRGDDAKGILIGQRIKAALEAEGLTVEWSGKIEDKLAVVGMKWQRRV